MAGENQGFMSRFNPFSASGSPTRQPQGQGNQNQQPNQQQRTPPASQQQQNGPANNQLQNGAPQGDPNNPASQQKNPLDELNTIWNPPIANNPTNQGNPGNGNNQGNQQQQTNPTVPAYDGYTVPWDDSNVRTRLKSVDFTRNAPPELMTKLAAGDLTALPELLNHVGREAFVAAAQTTHGMVDKGVRTGLDRFKGGLDDHLRDYNVRNQNTDNEIIQHPNVAPVFNMMKNQIAQNNPNLSPQQVAQQAQKWFDTVSAQMTGKQQAQESQKTAPRTMDWLESLGQGEVDQDSPYNPTGF